jgi:hypothetical protein
MADAMTDASSNLHVELRGDLIIVTEPETGSYAVYAMPEGDHWIKAVGIPIGFSRVQGASLVRRLR